MAELEDWELEYAENVKKDPPSPPTKIMFFIPVKKKVPLDDSKTVSDFKREYKKLISYFYTD